MERLTLRPMILCLLWLLPLLSPAADYYWVGGSGNWSDLTHWVTTSGGVIQHSVVPSADDRVFFDANSFDGPNQLVAINTDNIFFRDMDWTGATGNPVFQGGAEVVINVYGSLTFIEAMAVDLEGDIRFLATSAGQQVSSAGHAFGRTVSFAGAGGWQLEGALIADSLIELRRGGLVTNDQFLESDYFHVVVDAPQLASLDLGASRVVANGIGDALDPNVPLWPVLFRIDGELTFSAGTSVFELTHSTTFFRIEANDLNFHRVFFSNPAAGAVMDLVLSSGLYVDSLQFLGNGNINQSVRLGYVSLTPGKQYSFLSGEVYTIDAIDASGTCLNPVILEADNQMGQAVFSTDQNLVVDYVNLRNIHAQGSGSFTANNVVDFGNNTGWILNPRQGMDLYWVGGAGNWEDPMHWALTSGGPGGACIPGGLDNVFFDANSFGGPNELVIINAENNYCRDMDWSGAAGTPILLGDAATNLHIQGSLTLIGDMEMLYEGRIFFESTTPGQTIATGNHWLSSDVTFDGQGGEWTLQDSLKVNLEIFLRNGSLVTNDQYLDSYGFESLETTPRSLQLGNSTWGFHRAGSLSPQWELNGENLNFDAGTSTLRFNVPGDFEAFGNAPQDYHRVIFSNDESFLRSFTGANQVAFDTLIFLQGGTIQADFTCAALRLSPGFSYFLQSGRTQTVDTLIASGDCTGTVVIRSSSQGQPAFLFSDRDHPNLTNLALGGIHLTGAGSFTASQTLDLGGNAGWTILETTGRTLYWVGGDGLWEDPANWSLSSGGPGGACVPGPADDVVFDANSFDAGNQIVKEGAQGVAFCRNMRWQGSGFNPRIAIGDLELFGNLELQPDMTWSVGEVFLRGQDAHTLQMAGNAANIIWLATTGSYALLDALQLQSLIFNSGTFLTNSFPVTAVYLSGSPIDNPLVLDLADSHIEVTGPEFPLNVSATDVSLTVRPGNSVIELSASFTGLNWPAGHALNRVVFSNPEGTGRLRTSGQRDTAFFSRIDFYGDGEISGLNQTDSLIFAPGKSYLLEANQTQVINDYFRILGNNCTPIELSSSQRGQPSTIFMDDGVVIGDFIQMRDQRAAGGAAFYAGVHSTDIDNSNTGWIFESIETAVDVGFLGADAALCQGQPLTLNAYSFSAGEQYLWSTGSTTAEISVSAPGTYWARVTFADNCVIRDTVEVIAVDAFSVDLGNDTSICAGDTLILDAGTPAAGVVYRWQDGAAEPVFPAFSAGTYHVTLDLQGCTVADTLVLTVQAPPLIDLGADRGICPGDTLLLDPGVVAGATYRWQDGSTGQQFTASGGGVYSVEATTAGCTASDSVTITALTVPVFDLGEPAARCQGDTLRLDLTGLGAVYRWQDGTDSPVYEITTSGVYSLQVTSAAGCTASDTLVVAFDPLPELELGADREACEGDTIVLDAALADATYLWQDGSTASIFPAVRSGTYRLTVTAGACVVSDSVALQFLPLPRFDLGSDTSFCAGNALSLDLSGVGETYRWEDDSRLPSRVLNTSGAYSLTVTSAGCSFADTLELGVIPLPAVDLGADRSVCEGQPVMLDAGSEPGVQYLWQDGTVSATYDVTAAGVFIVRAENIFGCVRRDTVAVEFKPVPVFELGPDTSFCEGGVLEYDFSTITGTFLWENGSMLPTRRIESSDTLLLTIVREGCAATDSRVVEVRSGPFLELGPDRNFCAGDAFTLNPQAGPSTQLVWQDGSTLPVLTATATGLYSVTGTLNGCVREDSVRLTFTEFPDLDLGLDRNLCQGTLVSFNLENLGDTFRWSDGDTTGARDLSSAGIYWVEVSRLGCTSRDTIEISYRPVPVADLGPDLEFCPGDTILLDAGAYPNGTYMWQDGSIRQTFIVVAPGRYIVNVNVSGCADADTVEVREKALPPLDLGADATLCAGEVLELAPGEGWESYTWENGATLPVRVIDAAGRYWVTAALGNCRAADTIDVAVLPAPVVHLGADTVLCIGERLVLESPDTEADTYFWSTGDISRQITVGVPGVYWLEAETGGCFSRDSMELSFRSPPAIDLGPDREICRGETLVLSAGGMQEVVWQDSFAGPELTVTEAGLYWLVYDDGVCSLTDSVRVTVSACGRIDVFLPNAFSPNNDGVNDTYQVFFDPAAIIEDYHLMVFDRWGDQLYESFDPSAGWDGRAAGGRELPQGVYFLTVSFTFLDNGTPFTERLNADVLLVR